MSQYRPDIDTFSIINFYERRFRRILPALFIVIVVTYIEQIPGLIFNPNITQRGRTLPERFLSFPLQRYIDRTAISGPIITELTDTYEATVLFLHAALCQGDTCHIKLQGKLLYRNDNHLSLPGSNRRSAQYHFDFRKQQRHGLPAISDFML